MNKKTRYCRECGSKTNHSHCDICGRKTISMANRYNEKDLYILDDDIISDSDIQKQSKKYLKEQKHQQNIKEYQKRSERIQTTLPSLQGHEKRFEQNRKTSTNIPFKEDKIRLKSFLKFIIVISIIVGGLFPFLTRLFVFLYEDIAYDFIQVEDLPTIDSRSDEELFIWSSDQINKEDYVSLMQTYDENWDNYFKITTNNGYDLTLGPYESIYIPMEHEDYFNNGALLPLDDYELIKTTRESYFYEDIYVVLDEEIKRYALYYDDYDIDIFADDVATYYFDLQDIYEHEGVMTMYLVETLFDIDNNFYYDITHELHIDFDDMSYELIPIK